jgi:hypothetical protein
VLSPSARATGVTISSSPSDTSTILARRCIWNLHDE